MVNLSLDCLTLTHTSPAELIRSAAAAGFGLVSLWSSEPCAFPRQRMTLSMEQECAALLSDAGVALHTVKVIDLVSEEAIRNYRPVLGMGARLGGEAAPTRGGAAPARPARAD